MIHLSRRRVLSLYNLKRVLITGITQYGKTTTAKVIVKGLRRMGIGGMIIDPHWQYIHYVDVETNTVLDWNLRLVYGVPLINQPDETQQEICNRLLRGYYRTVIKRREQWDDIKFILIDEAQNFAPKTQTSSRNIIRKIVKEGAKFGVMVILITQLPQELDVPTRNQMGLWICHRLSDTGARMAIRYGCIPRELKELITRLEVGEAIIGSSLVRVEMNDNTCNTNPPLHSIDDR